MSNFSERKKLFKEMTSATNRRLITLINSTKKPEALFGTQIAQDVLPIFYEILRHQPHGYPLDLFIYSAGGQIDTPWPLVNLIREYAEDFRVVVPWRAHSAATLVCLGANQIHMGPLSSLSPIDPQFQIHSTDKKETVGAGVEDVYGYFSLMTDILSLDPPGRADALKLLAGRISPEILGKISRTRKEIRIIATNLLELHMSDSPTIEGIVSKLVEELPSHQYMINRREAKALGLPVHNLDHAVEALSARILASYREEVGMDEPGLSLELGNNENVKAMELSRAFIETEDRSFAFRSQYLVHRDGRVERRGDQWREVK